MDEKIFYFLCVVSTCILYLQLNETFMILVFLVLNALFIWGFFAATRKEELFNLEVAPLPQWLAKPLYNCPFCMSSVWGLIGFAFFLNFPPFVGELWSLGWYYLPAYCLQLCGLNYLILLFVGSND